MRFLGICGLGFIDARRIWQVTLAETLVNILADRSNSFAAQLNTVGSHIGDQASGFAANIDAFI